MTFAVRIWAEKDGQGISMTLEGGGYLEGERADDMVMTGTMELAGAGSQTFGFVQREGRAYVSVNGLWQELPPAALGPEQGARLEDELAGLDFTRFVTDVQVTSGATFLGEPVTKIVGTIDTQGLLGGIFGQLGAATQGLGGGLGAFTPPEEALRALGDVRVVLYISDTTHLVKAMRMEFTVDVEGETGTFTVDYALRSVNEPVEIPKPAVVA